MEPHGGGSERRIAVGRWPAKFSRDVDSRGEFLTVLDHWRPAVGKTSRIRRLRNGLIMIPPEERRHRPLPIT